MDGDASEIRPQEGPQSAFLESAADIAVIGGSAFGGKTYGLLLECLRHIENPGFGAVIFRRTSPQITNEGGLWDTSERIYPLVGGNAKVGTLDWRFPSGANVGMRHLQREANKYDWQGTAIPLLCFDELTHFSESQFFYLISRSRTHCGVRPYVRGSCNADASSWVKRFLAPWVDKAYPDPARSGELRWFVRIDGRLVWARTRAELVALHPGLQPKSVTFIRSSIFDNTIGMREDPDYLGNLQALLPVEQGRLLHGDWDIKREGIVYPHFDTCLVDPFNLPSGQDCGGIDFGWNHPFCALGGVLDHDDVLWVHYERYQSWCTRPMHGAALPLGVEWSADPSRPESIAELRLGGHEVYPCVHMGDRPLLSGIDMVSERIRTRRLKVSKECVNLVREMGVYSYDDEKYSEVPIDRDNHAPDALRYQIVRIDRGRALPNRPPTLPGDDGVKLEKTIARFAERKRRELAEAEVAKATGIPPAGERESKRRRVREEASPGSEPTPETEPDEDDDQPWWVRHDPEDDD